VPPPAPEPFNRETDQVVALPHRELKPWDPIPNEWYKPCKKNERPVYPSEFIGVEPPVRIDEPKRIGDNLVSKKDRYGHPMRDKKDHVIEEVGALHLPGVGGKQPGGVMFISPGVLFDELQTNPSNSLQIMLKGPHGSLFRRTLIRAGFTKEEWYYTALVKYHTSNSNPKTPELKWSIPALEHEIKRQKPRIIVCMGKPVFDFFNYPERATMADVYGRFFWSQRYQTVYYPMDNILKPVLHPEYLDRYELDIKQVQIEFTMMSQGGRAEVTEHYHTIRNSEELGNLMTEIKDKQCENIAIDCEWSGRSWLDGNLRSLQLCWMPGHAAYVRLMDDKLNYVFDGHSIPTRLPYKSLLVLNPDIMKSAREAAAPLNDPKIKFIGHNASADMPWLDHKLGIDVYKKFSFDTMYALHTINECADLGLERLALRYTNLGRYDAELIDWKKANGWDEDDNLGYGEVPDEILIPYASRDVNATLISWFQLFNSLSWEGLLQYYRDFVLPFVTDGFYEMTDCGLLVDVEFLETMRLVFKRNVEVLEAEFSKRTHEDTILGFRTMMVSLGAREVNPNDPVILKERIILAESTFAKIDSLLKAAIMPANGLIDASKPSVIEAFKTLEEFGELIPHASWERLKRCYKFMLASQTFNVDSTDHVRYWMFRVRNLEPIKATKKEGFQLAWSKVHPDEKQQWDLVHDPTKNQTIYMPAADKQTIKIYSYHDPAVAQLQELKTTATIVKSFLGDNPSEGVQKWVQSDGRIHANFALTETARPRAWSPNILNWPKSVTRPLEAAFERVQKAHPKWTVEKHGEFVEIDNKDRPTSLRSCIVAPPGWAIIDMDLKTAEVMALAYISGDENMIRVLTEQDYQFALSVEKDAKGKSKVLRITYNENSPSERDPALICPLTDPRLLRNERHFVHPRRDLHWEMAESVAERPREKLDERMMRDGVGKIGNFSIPYGTSTAALERLVEASIGRSPDPGTGQRMIDMWETRYPVAAEFQRSMERRIEDPGWWRSPSGRIRHFYFDNIKQLFDVRELEESKNMSRDEKWEESKRLFGSKMRIMSHPAREARNFPCQELVAATTAHAILDFIAKRREMGLKARVGILLYDAVTVFAPLEELKVATELLKNCLTIWRPWTINGRTFNFEADVTHSLRWGMKPTKEERQLLDRHL